MKSMKFFIVLMLIANAFLSGCATIPPSKSLPLDNTTHTIYFIYRGWHTSILLDAKSLVVQVPQLELDLKNQKYVRIGWGDGDYFTGKNKSFTSATKALFASSYSAIQLLPYDYDPFWEIPLETRVPLAITEFGLHNLTIYIRDSIKLDKQGRPIQLSAFGEATGLFFQANESYNAFSNCNTWSGNALRAAGFPIANRLTAQGVFKQASVISKIQAEHGSFALGHN